MPEFRSIVVPVQYASVVLECEPDGLVQVAGFVRRSLEKGVKPLDLIEEMAKSGWSRGFAEWYVTEAAAGTDELRLESPYTAYPRGRLGGGHAVSAEDLVRVAGAFSLLNVSALLWVAGIAVAILAPSDSGWSALWSILLLYATQFSAVICAVIAAGKASPQLKMNPTASVVVAALVGLIPFVGYLLVASTLSGKLARYLKSADVRIGMLGPDRTSLEEAMRARGTER